jgi:hypothetical protein
MYYVHIISFCFPLNPLVKVWLQFLLRNDHAMTIVTSILQKSNGQCTVLILIDHLEDFTIILHYFSGQSFQATLPLVFTRSPRAAPCSSALGHNCGVGTAREAMSATRRPGTPWADAASRNPRPGRSVTKGNTNKITPS